jgi:hypothetical protein
MPNAALSDCFNALYGAGGGSRTPDLSLTKRLLYQLSYTGAKGR